MLEDSPLRSSIYVLQHPVPDKKVFLKFVYLPFLFSLHYVVPHLSSPKKLADYPRDSNTNKRKELGPALCPKVLKYTKIEQRQRKKTRKEKKEKERKRN